VFVYGVHGVYRVHDLRISCASFELADRQATRAAAPSASEALDTFRMSLYS